MTAEAAPPAKQPVPDSRWNETIRRAAVALEKHDTLLFGAYLDPDAMGSMLALAVYLKLAGNKTIYLLQSDVLSSKLDFMLEIIAQYRLQVVKTAAELTQIAPRIEAAVFFDTANPHLLPHFSLIEQQLLKRGIPTIEIDHHFGNDSMPLNPGAIHLYREANASTEIVAELLQDLQANHPEKPDPFTQKSILVCLLTGLLYDTAGGKAPPFSESFSYWTGFLEARLTHETQWRFGEPERKGDSLLAKFGNILQLQNHLIRLDDEKILCIGTIAESIHNESGVALLNLLDSTYPAFRKISQPFDSQWFFDVKMSLLDLVPEKSGKVGMVFFNGRTPDGTRDCFYLKLRRSVDYNGYDLRRLEQPVRASFSEYYLGGGGHPGAVSFRMIPHDEKDFLTRVHAVRDHLRRKIP